MGRGSFKTHGDHGKEPDCGEDDDDGVLGVENVGVTEPGVVGVMDMVSNIN